jgi:hypothetical protein
MIPCPFSPRSHPLRGFFSAVKAKMTVFLEIIRKSPVFLLRFRSLAMIYCNKNIRISRAGRSMTAQSPARFEQRRKTDAPDL